MKHTPGLKPTERRARGRAPVRMTEESARLALAVAHSPLAQSVFAELGAASRPGQQRHALSPSLV